MNENTDPTTLGGSIAGPGGPHDFGEVVIDMTNSVLLDGAEVVLVEPVRDGERDEKAAMAIVLRGRVNKTPKRAQVLFLTGADGAAALVTELIALASRAGWGDEFLDLVKERMEAMPSKP